MQGARCDADDCDQFEQHGPTGHITINVAEFEPQQRRAIIFQLNQQGIIDLDGQEYVRLTKGGEIPNVGHIRIDLCAGHLLTALTQYGVLNAEDENAMENDPEAEDLSTSKP